MNSALQQREFQHLAIELIDEPQLPSRTEMDEQRMEDLIASIRENGLIQPISVVKVGDRYEVIAGHRRRIACARAGLTTVPCIVYPNRDVPLTVIQAHENSKREDLNPADEAIWFSELLERECGGDIEKLAGLVGEKRSYVDNRLQLFLGDQQVFEALQRGDIKIGVAHELNKCPDEHYRRYYLDCAIRGGATVSMVAGWIAEWKTLFGNKPPAAPAAPIAPSPGVIDPSGPFVCYICHGREHVHTMQQLWVHQHCQLAILDKLLASARGE